MSDRTMLYMCKVNRESSYICTRKYIRPVEITSSAILTDFATYTIQIQIQIQE